MLKKYIIGLLFILLVPCANAIAGIGLSYDQMVFRLSEFDMQQGQNKYVGKSSDGLAVLEVSGSKADITDAALLVSLPDIPVVIDRQTERLLRFYINTGPKWVGAVDWLNKALPKAIKTGGKETFVRGKKR